VTRHHFSCGWQFLGLRPLRHSFFLPGLRILPPKTEFPPPRRLFVLMCVSWFWLCCLEAYHLLLLIALAVQPPIEPSTYPCPAPPPFFKQTPTQPPTKGHPLWILHMHMGSKRNETSAGKKKKKVAIKKFNLISNFEMYGKPNSEPPFVNGNRNAFVSTSHLNFPP